jgi:hypothetical protein
MGKQVKVVVSTPTNYRPGMGDQPGRVPSTAFSSGAPTNAPSQTVALTAKGPAVEGKDSHPTPPAHVPPPPSAATTGPKIANPSVDYDTQQGSRITSGDPDANVDYLGEQSQQLQDKGGA